MAEQVKLRERKQSGVARLEAGEKVPQGGNATLLQRDNAAGGAERSRHRAAEGDEIEAGVVRWERRSGPAIVVLLRDPHTRLRAELREQLGLERAAVRQQPELGLEPRRVGPFPRGASRRTPAEGSGAHGQRSQSK